MHKINNLARLCERANWTDSDVHCSAYVSHRMFPSWRFSLRPAWSHGESLLILWVIFGWLIWERRDRCVMIAGQSFQEIKKHIVSRSMCLSISCQLWLFKTCGPGPANIPRIGWYGMIWRIYSNPLWLTILVGSKPDKHHGKTMEQTSRFPLQHPASHRNLHQGRLCCEILQATNCVWSLTWIWQRLRRRAMQGASFSVAVDPSSQSFIVGQWGYSTRVPHYNP